LELLIRHIGLVDDKAVFIIGDGMAEYAEVKLTPPDKFEVEPHNTDLQSALRWLLDDYLKMPIEPNKIKAGNVLNALASWGNDCFDKLFQNDCIKNRWNEAIENGLNSLQINIESKNPTVLAWAWEALKSDKLGYIGLRVRIKRQLTNSAPDSDNSYPVSTLHSKKLNILYIISRPDNNMDIKFLALIKPLVDFAYGGLEYW
jgi:hypothetical protein